MGAPLRRPVAAFIETGHGGGQGVGQVSLLLGPHADQQLAQALVREAIGADPAVAGRVAAQPAHGAPPIGRLLGEAAEASSRVPPSAYVLYRHQETVGGIPAGMGNHNR